MTKLEREIILEAIQQKKDLVMHFHEEGKRTDEWTNHEIVSDGLLALRDLAESLGVEA